MGLCQKSSSQIQTVSSTKAMLAPQNYDATSFYFSTQNLLRIDADCLVLFTHQNINLKKNYFLSKTGRMQTKKVQEYAQSYLKNQKKTFKSGQSIIFPISISTLRFKFVCLVGLNIWNGKKKIKQNIEDIYSNLFKGLQKLSIKSLAIAQIDEEFGVPIHLGCKLLAEKIYQNRQWIKIVTFLCNDNNSQSFYIENVTSINKRAKIGQEELTSIRTVNTAKQSDYY